ncbi:unnamed protein product [Notodromas monacha]|uniref:ADF-H domain-containing protein n=1 Tax=Notodromas monacha TaxID=399045 RepID=A0A7R9GBQ1_9CRUS|nr:unnamed protein product [Notodromas monacha]CAG0916608.1 unnamed protein product [Notodromas monacha]
MSSGVTVADVCKTLFEEIKKDKKHRYVIFYIKDEKQIEVETIGEFWSQLFVPKATDLSEASESAVEEKLRATDRQ